MIGGSPSLRRSRPMVTETVLVKGSAYSSHTCSSSCSALSGAGIARRSASRTARAVADAAARTLELVGTGAAAPPARVDPPQRGLTVINPHEERGVGLPDTLTVFMAWFL